MTEEIKMDRKDQLIEQFPNLLNQHTSFLLYKNYPLEVYEQFDLLESVCKQITDIFPKEKLIIDTVSYKFSRLQIAFKTDPNVQQLNVLKARTEVQYFTLNNNPHE